MRIPDLLYRAPFLSVDRKALEETLGLAFMGRELGTQLHDHLSRARVPSARLRRSIGSGRRSPGPGGPPAPSAPPTELGDTETFDPSCYGADLFLRTLLEQSFRLRLGHRDYPVNLDFLQRVLAHAPTDPETIRLRQGILHELATDDDLRRRFEELYRDLFDLMSLMKTPGYSGGLDLAAFRLDILRQLRAVIDRMHDDFADSTSALRRLHESAAETRRDEPYRLLAALLEYESGMARMTLDVTIGADGRLRAFDVREIEENDSNRFHRRPLRRLLDRLGLVFRGVSISNRELLDRLVNEVFRRLADPMVPYVQLVGHLEFYLTSLSFRHHAESRGLRVCLPELQTPETRDQGGIRAVDLFNPLLLVDPEPPVPCSLHTDADASVVLITGPNSGGKTRLLQALALTQLLAHSGTWVPCSRASLLVQRGLFVSLIEEEGARVTEGRLGRELVRIRSLFETMPPHSMVILDELCSGTNPSEGIEVFTMVLQLLREVRPTAFVTTHFLDFARSLQQDPVIEELQFLQVSVDEHLRSTYQFVEGVADTSLAAVTAQRLGVTFDRLAEAIRRRRAPGAHDP